MTRSTNARLAGITFVVYIVAGISSMMITGRENASSVLSIVMSLSAVVLGVTLYAITRDVDADLAMIALACRVVESIPINERASAIFFAIASTIFSVLLLRGRMIPVALAWLGVAASVLLVVLLLLQRAGLFTSGTSWSSSVTWIVWMPMLVFELALAAWFIAKGVLPESQTRRHSEDPRSLIV
jgi:hypothetical protein